MTTYVRSCMFHCCLNVEVYMFYINQDRDHNLILLLELFIAFYLYS